MNLDSIFPDDLTEEDEIRTIIREHWLDFDFRINDDRSIDVYGDVKFPEFSSFLRQLPLQFRHVSGDFDCSFLVNLTTLKGSPIEVGGTFNCASTSVQSLEYAPKSAEKLVFDNTIKSLSTNCNCDFKLVHMLVRNSNPVEGLPKTILQNMAHMPIVFKYQNYYDVWNNNDGLFNEQEFNSLITEIKEGLK